MSGENTLVLPYAFVESSAPKAILASRVLVEAELLWRGDVIGVAHVRPRETLCVGDLGLDVPGGESTVVARATKEGVFLVLPNGALVPAGCRMTLRLGRTKLRIALVADDGAAVPRTKSDGRLRTALLGAGVLHLAILACIIHGRATPGSIEGDNRAAMARYMAAAEARAAAEVAMSSPASSSVFEAQGSVASAAPAKDQGTAGSVSHTNQGARMRDTRGVDRHASIAGERRDAVDVSYEDVTTFGMIGLATGGTSGRNAGSSPWARETGAPAMGNVFGQTIDDAMGVGGLGLSSAGSGSGERGQGVALDGIHTAGMASPEGLGLGAIGTLGHGAGFGVAGGSGSSIGRLGSGHQVRSPSLCMCGQTQVNGRLPPEAIQRVVRANFGRFRACYERALDRNPTLEGRVAVKFVIDRSGAVSTMQAGESSMPDEVTSCVVRAFGNLSFPQPEGGIVTVVYPITFTPT